MGGLFQRCFKEVVRLSKMNSLEKKGLFMAKILFEEMMEIGNSKYEIVKAAAREARRLNHLRFMRQPETIPIPDLEEKKTPEEKVTILALKRLIDGKVRIIGSGKE
jgi:DNA-directed RNA polymerase omega subunit